MWLLSVFFALIAMSFCPAESQDSEAQECGRYGPHAVDNDGQIDFKNHVAQPNELPWMVMILNMGLVENKHTRDKNIYLSDGVLIHPRVALASRNSIAGTGPEDLIVRAGDWDVSAYCKMYVQERNVSKLILPEYEKTGKSQHRLVTLILSSPFVLGENIGVLCLPRETDEYDRLRCIISAWSGNVFNPNGNQLRRVSVPIISNNECHGVYVDYSNRYGVEILLYRDYVCAGSKEHSKMCQRDHGCPLICPLVNDPSRYVLVGLDISRFRSNNDFPLPYQFADVSAARDWIDHEMLVNGLNTSVYTLISSKRREDDHCLVVF